jgi:hypothetical protein
MKQISIIIFIAFSFMACSNNAQQTEESIVNQSAQEIGLVESENSNEFIDENAAIISLDNDTYEFGVVKEGEKVKHVYEFTNTGKSPLIISNVSASCGCTTPEYSQHPINPGEKGSITVVFDSQNQIGMQQKIITVLSNAEPSRTILQLKGEVK